MAPTIVTKQREAVHRASARRAARRSSGTVLQIARQPDRPQAAAAERDRRCRARSSATRHARRPSAAFIDSREGRDLVGVYGHTPFITPDDTDTIGATPEIGATTAIEFRGKQTMIAAAEPQRRGTGSAEVVEPEVSA